MFAFKKTFPGFDWFLTEELQGRNRIRYFQLCGQRLTWTLVHPDSTVQSLGNLWKTADFPADGFLKALGLGSGSALLCLSGFALWILNQLGHEHLLSMTGQMFTPKVGHRCISFWICGCVCLSVSL